MEEKQGKQLTFYTRTCTKFQVHIFENRHGFFKPSPVGNVLHLFKLHRKEENSVDPGTSFRMMSDSDLTPKEQETIQHSKDPQLL